MKGVFITFEGSEGCGKSTQSKMLAQYLRRIGKRVVYLREPGGTGVSEKIRGILLDPANRSMLPACEMLLYMASRSQVVAEVIRPALKKGRIVVCDRFLDSTLAYQGYGLGMDIGYIRCIGDFSTSGIKPDLTFYLDLPLKKGLAHRNGNKDRIEKRPLDYHRRVRNGYLSLARSEPRRMKVVKVEDDKKMTQEKIRNTVLGFLKNKGC